MLLSKPSQTLTAKAGAEADPPINCFCMYEIIRLTPRNEITIKSFVAEISGTDEVALLPSTEEAGTTYRVVELNIFNNDNTPHDITITWSDSESDTVVHYGNNVAARKTMYYSKYVGWRTDV